MVYLLRECDGQTEHSLAGTSKWRPVSVPGWPGPTAQVPKATCAAGFAVLASSPNQAYLEKLRSEGTRKPQELDVEAKPVAEMLRTLVLKQTFDAADRDHSGGLSKAEIGLLLHRVMPEMPAQLLHQVWNSVDEDSDGFVTFKEFLTWMEQDSHSDFASALTKATGTPGIAMVAIFRLWDKDESGTISREEVEKLMVMTGLDAASTDISSLFGAMDKNQDGTISYAEFASFLFPRSQ